jgi:hypothetical protein
MTVNNFNWFLHSLLFIHTERVIKAQKEKAEKQQARGGKDEDEGDIEGINVEGDEN